MVSRIAVIGAGWYGCHVSSSLKALGFDVKIFDQHSRPLNEASGNNQFRLHLGFHYPRHHGTRVQSRDGFSRFMERYPGLSREVPENIYAVPTEESLIDFQTYRLIMTSTGIDFREETKASIPIHKISGMMQTKERVLLIEQARRYFKEALGDSLVLDHKVASVEDDVDCIRVDGESFDLLIDASWGRYMGLPMPFFYEPTMLLYYETNQAFPAVTFVDGPLCSIYPTEDSNIYTLSSVPHTPLGQVHSAQEAKKILDSVNSDLVAAKVKAMEDQISYYLPTFREQFRFVGPQLAIKAKPIGNFDDRSCSVFRRGRIFHIMSGKIDTIFFAMERILSVIETSRQFGATSLSSPLRKDIMARANDIGHVGLGGSI
ncbi:FAD-dependent oxidoreductase [Granulibacter bethesdensis]|uniref:FAD-dependent oxidoreductase n=1 Tax=Granulibacter bethesdensis TaxID=364410 RepID=UPI00090CB9EF|nr:FAD-dependent oxidoreductase [Granulibacter bethesdensis]APH59853.1 Hypothetical protein GbCGDNIH7_8355 [Granulibacter bethesdensis]